MAKFTEGGIEFERDSRFNIDFNEVKASLEKVKKGTGGWWVGRCKAHPDGRPSLVWSLQPLDNTSPL